MRSGCDANHLPERGGIKLSADLKWKQPLKADDPNDVLRPKLFPDPAPAIVMFHLRCLELPPA